MPVPFFEDCPTFSAISLGVENSIGIALEGEPGFESWFTIDVASGDYRFTVDAARVDGADSNIIYEIRAFDQFGQTERSEQIARINEITSTHRSSEVWGVSEAKPAWIRFRNDNAALDLTFTVTNE